MCVLLSKVFLLIYEFNFAHLECFVSFSTSLLSTKSQILSELIIPCVVSKCIRNYSHQSQHHYPAKALFALRPEEKCLIARANSIVIDQLMCWHGTITSLFVTLYNHRESQLRWTDRRG